MKNTGWWSLSVAIVLSGLAFGVAAHSQDRVTYEYKIIYRESGDNDTKKQFAHLNEAGAQGWDLVSVVAEEDHQTVRYYLKRAIKP